MAWISLSTTFRVLSCALLLSTVSADGLRGRQLASSCKFKAPGQMRGKTDCGREAFCDWDMTKNPFGGGECADRFTCKFKAPGQMRGKTECGRTNGCSWDRTKNAAGGGECSEIATSCKLKGPGQMRGKRECGRTDGCSWDLTKNAAGGGECSEITTSCKLKGPGQMRGKRECGRTDGCSWDLTKNAAGGGECADTKCIVMCNIRGLFPCGFGIFGRPETVHSGGFAWCCTEGVTKCASF